MNLFLMTTYMLVWPLIVAIMMGVMGWGVVNDARDAHRTGEDIV